jgi:hypothetical protein
MNNPELMMIKEDFEHYEIEKPNYKIFAFVLVSVPILFLFVALFPQFFDGISKVIENSINNLILDIEEVIILEP